MDQEEFDAVIIGAGQGGIPLARAFANAGVKTALVEERHVGGTCINEGCTPTKALVASAKAASLARRAEEYGIQIDSVGTDLQAIMARKERIVASFRNSKLDRIKNTSNLSLVRGTGRFQSPRQIRVTNGSSVQNLTSDITVINSGARPRIPDLPGLQEVPSLTSRSILELQHLPEHLIVLGGGYVGLEYAQMFCRFGSRVTIVTRSNQLLPREDQDIARELRSILEQEGIRIHLDAHPIHAQSSQQGLQLSFEQAGRTVDVSGSVLLLAVGRLPNTEQLALELAGVDTDQAGYILVDPQLRTSGERIYAIGDVKGGPAFTHISYDDYRILRDNLLEGSSRSIEGRLVPYTLFTDPQLGRVGMTEEGAQEAEIPYRVAKLPMSHVARAIESGQTQGLVKVLVDPRSELILGAAVLGMEGGEIMGALQIAMMGEVPYSDLEQAVFAHPTLMELFNNLFSRVAEPEST